MIFAKAKVRNIDEFIGEELCLGGTLGNIWGVEFRRKFRQSVVRLMTTAWRILRPGPDRIRSSNRNVSQANPDYKINNYNINAYFVSLLPSLGAPCSLLVGVLLFILPRFPSEEDCCFFSSASRKEFKYTLLVLSTWKCTSFGDLGKYNYKNTSVGWMIKKLHKTLHTLSLTVGFLYHIVKHVLF